MWSDTSDDKYTPKYLRMISELSEHYAIPVHITGYHNMARDKWKILDLPFVLKNLSSMQMTKSAGWVSGS